MNLWEQLRDWSLPLYRDARVIKETRQKLAERPQLDASAFAKTHFPPDKQAVAERIWEITKECSVVNITGALPEDKFVEDLKMDDLDSMSLLELTIQVEKEFNIEIPKDRLREIRTLGELVDEICRRKRNE